MASDGKTFSHSRLQTLDDCPRRYRFRYVEGLKEAFQTIEAFVGSRVHDAIQWAYMEREAKSEPPVSAVLERYHAAWRERMGPGVRVVRDGLTAEQYRTEGEGILRRHQETVFLEDRLETLAVEPRVELRLGDNAYVGFIDRLARDGSGTMHVVDYKTSKSMPENIAATGLQARGYGASVLEQHGGVEVALRYEYLRHGKRLEETLARSQVDGVVSAIGARIEGALAAERVGDFPARPSPLCRWCGFREDCDASPFRSLGPRAVASAVVRGDAPPVEPKGQARPVEYMSTPVRAAPAAASSLGECPRCGAALVRRSGSRGDMVACQRYPDCGHASR